MKEYYIVNYRGDRFAATTLNEALLLAALEPGTVGYWARTSQTFPDAGAARMWGTSKDWVEFDTDQVIETLDKHWGGQN